MQQNLQVLRGFASLLVVLHHYLLANRDYGRGGIASFSNLAELGACGVDLFFCISGYVMVGSVTKKTNFSARDFAIGRVIRILPAYWITSTLFIALFALNLVHKVGLSAVFTESVFSLQYILSSYLLIPIFNPQSGHLQPFLSQGWTLSYELYFYLLIMGAAIFTNGNYIRTVVVCGGLLVAGPLMFHTSEGVMGEFFGNTIVLEFILGMFVYHITRWTNVLGTLAALLGFLLLAATMPLKVIEYRVLQWGIPSALILYGILALEGILPLPRLLKTIGDASYSLYLTHGALVYIYGGLLKRGWFATVTLQNLAILVGTVAAVFMAIIFYRYVEQPLLECLNKNFRPKRVAYV